MLFLGEQLSWKFIKGAEDKLLAVTFRNSSFVFFVLVWTDLFVFSASGLVWDFC